MNARATIRSHSVLVLLALVSSACSTIRYTPLSSVQIPAVDHATLMHGVPGESQSISEKLALPHNSPREKFMLSRAFLHEFTSQIGSDDYSLIGTIAASGSAYNTMSGLEQSAIARAAKEGGDVVLVIDSGVTLRPWSYTAPGYSTTTSQASASGVLIGNTAYASGSGTSQTTYTPPQTYSGVHQLPHANALVFKYVPGRGARDKAIMDLDDEQLAALLGRVDEITHSSGITFSEAQRTIDEALAQAQARSRKPSP
jgi:hypothetical protein